VSEARLVDAHASPPVPSGDEVPEQLVELVDRHTSPFTVGEKQPHRPQL
jgi:hypothetical protein